MPEQRNDQVSIGEQARDKRIEQFRPVLHVEGRLEPSDLLFPLALAQSQKKEKEEKEENEEKEEES